MIQFPAWFWSLLALLTGLGLALLVGLGLRLLYGKLTPRDRTE